METRIYRSEKNDKTTEQENGLCYTGTMNATEDRITAIEMKLAYLEDFLNKLQAVTVEHTAVIDRIQGETRAIKDKITDLAGSAQDIPNVRPPHY